MEMKTATPNQVKSITKLASLHHKRAIIKHVFFLVAFGLSASATASQIVYHTTNPDNTSPLTGWTTDTKSGLQWLDITDTAGLTYAQVESNPLYSGWSYATNTELNQLVTDATNITIEPSQNLQIVINDGITHVGYNQGAYGLTGFNKMIVTNTNTLAGITLTHLFDPLISMLGSTFDLYTKETTGYPTYDAYLQTTGFDLYNNYYHYTYTNGLLAPDAGQGLYEIGHIASNAIISLPNGNGQFLYQAVDVAYYTNYGSIYAPNTGTGSFLVRDTAMFATPIPAAIWLVGSTLAGLVGFAGRKPIKRGKAHS